MCGGFGRSAIKYLTDLNHNRKLDGKEYLLSDFVHTTATDECAACQRELASLVPAVVQHCAGIMAQGTPWQRWLVAGLRAGCPSVILPRHLIRRLSAWRCPNARCRLFWLGGSGCKALISVLPGSLKTLIAWS